MSLPRPNIKTTPPSLPSNTVLREDLHQYLAENINKRLILVAAGGGWGKSTLLSSYAASSSHSCLWYNIDPGDRDPRALISMLAYGICEILPETERLLEPVQKELSMGLPDLLPVVKGLMNALLGLMPKKLIIIFDDYHLADSPALNSVLHQLLSLAPLNLQFIVSTRSPPGIALSRLKLHEDMLELTAPKLGFTRDELLQYIERCFAIRLPAEEVEPILEATGGWPISIRLVAEQRLRSRSGNLPQLPAVTGNRQRLISDYLQEQYFAQMPPRMQQFLIRSSLFDYFTPELLRDLIGWEAAEKDLAELSDSANLVIKIDPKERVYRYHHLFHSFLSDRLVTNCNEESIRSMREKAATYFFEKGLRKESFKQYVETRDFRNAARVLEQSIDDLLFKGTAGHSLWRISEMPVQDLAPYLPLLFTKGWLSFQSGNWDDSLPVLEQVRISAIAEKNPLLYGHALRVLMTIHFYQDDYGTAEVIARECLRNLPSDSPPAVAIGSQLAVILMQQGKTREAAGQWDQLRSCPLLAENRQQAMEVNLLHGFNHSYILGQFSRAIDQIDTAEQYFRQHDHFGRHGISLLLKATVLFEMGDFEKAQRVFDECILDMQRKGYLSSLGLAYATAMIVAMENQDFKHAATLYSSLKNKFSGKTGRKFWKRNALHCAEALYAYHHDDLDGFFLSSETAMRFIEESGFWTDRYLFGCAFANRYAALGNLDMAIALLERIIQSVSANGALYWEARTRFLLSALHYDQGVLDDALNQLQKALGIARQHHYAFLFLKKERPLARRMLPLALSHKIQPDFVAFLLARLMDDIENPLIPFLKHPDSELKVAAIRELTRIGSREAEAELSALLMDEDPEVGKAALSAIHHIQCLEPLPLHTKLLGDFHLRQGAKTVPAGSWRRKAAKSIFKYLIFNNNTDIPAERLIHILDETSGFDDARKRFHQAVTVIRRALEPGITPKRESRYLKFGEGVYRFLMPEASTIDTTEFERLCRDARLAKKKGEVDVAAESYSGALALYGGEFLANEPYDAWSLPIREHFEALYQTALHETAIHSFKQFDFDTCLRRLHVLLEKDSWNEDAYHLMMRCYYALGNRAKLIKTYHTCRQTLKSELGIAPNQQITELFHQTTRRAT